MLGVRRWVRGALDRCRGARRYEPRHRHGPIRDTRLKTGPTHMMAAFARPEMSRNRPGMGHPLPGMTHPLLGMDRPLPGIGHPLLGMGRPLPGIAHPLPGMTHPLLGIGPPLLGMAHPLQGTARSLPGAAHPPSSRAWPVLPAAGVIPETAGLLRPRLTALESARRARKARENSLARETGYG